MFLAPAAASPAQAPGGGSPFAVHCVAMPPSPASPATQAGEPLPVGPAVDQTAYSGAHQHYDAPGAQTGTKFLERNEFVCLDHGGKS